MKFNIIAAITSEWGLGYKGRLPWSKFTEDMKWFRELTANSIVIMGRKTWESMNSIPLKGRVNIVVGKSLIADIPSETEPVFFRKTFSEALSVGKIFNRKRKYEPSTSGPGASPSASVDSGRKVFVIGGVGLYREALNHPDCQFIYLNRVNTNGKFSDYFPVDCYFPKLSGDNFQLDEIIRDDKAEVGAWNRAIQALPFCMIRYVRIGMSAVTGGQSRQVPETVRFSTTVLLDTHKLRGPQLLYFNESGYLRALSDILIHGIERDDRTGVGNKSLFGLHFRYDLSRGFPLFTSKRTFWKGIVAELLWFLSGSTDANVLSAQGVNIWDGNSSRKFLDSRGLNDLEVGDIGPSYGFQFRHQGAKYYGADWDHRGDGFDQVEYVVNQIRQNPTGRRALINLWNPSDTDRMALPPCLYGYQFYVAEGKISCLITQRSGDTFLGVPFNVASASLLTHMIGRLTGLQPHELIHNIADAHIYSNHFEAVQEQINRLAGPWPQLEIANNGQQKIADFKADDFKIIGYFPEASIKADMAV